MAEKRMTIATVADLLDVSPQTIRMYEQNGIFCCEKGEENGYRYFDRVNMNVLTWARTYRGLGFSMEETARLLNDCGVEEAIAQYGERIQAMEKEIAFEKLKRDVLERHQLEIERAVAHLGTAEICESPACYYCVMGSVGKPMPNEAQRERLREWNAYAPFVGPAGVIPMEEMNPNGGMGSLVRMMFAEYADYLKANVSSPVVFCPVRKCVHAYFMRRNETQMPFQHNMGFVFDYMREMHLNCTGDVIVQPLLILKKTTEHILYAQAWIPVD